MKISARNNKKAWEKPAIDLMNIKRDTFGGSGNAAEGGNPDSTKWRQKTTKSRGSRS